ncbi:MAG: hypothetical protein J6M94_04290, partial [Prevotella sp.]|nr:hypothetical protein [Prevotella sp.]
LSDKWLMSGSSNTKAVAFGTEGVAYNILEDEEKGEVAFDYAKTTYPLTFVDGSRALVLNASKDYIVSTSGTSKAAAWWKLINVNDLAEGCGVLDDGMMGADGKAGAVRKVVRDKRLLIVTRGATYTLTGNRME